MCHIHIYFTFPSSKYYSCLASFELCSCRTGRPSALPCGCTPWAWAGGSGVWCRYTRSWSAPACHPCGAFLQQSVAISRGRTGDLECWDWQWNSSMACIYTTLTRMYYVTSVRSPVILQQDQGGARYKLGSSYMVRITTNQNQCIYRFLRHIILVAAPLL